MTDEAVVEGLVLVAQRSQQREERQTALAGHTGPGVDVTVGLVLDVELDPLTTVRVDGAGEEGLCVTARGEDRARGADQLADDHSLGAVDDERPTVGHHREVPHEDRLLLDLAGVGVHEASAHEDRCGVGHVLLLALLDRELRSGAQVRIRRVELELEAQATGEVLDRADVLERLLEAMVKEPPEALSLDSDQVWKGKGLVDVGERDALGTLGP